MDKKKLVTVGLVGAGVAGVCLAAKALAKACGNCGIDMDLEVLRVGDKEITLPCKVNELLDMGFTLYGEYCHENIFGLPECSAWLKKDNEIVAAIGYSSDGLVKHFQIGADDMEALGVSFCGGQVVYGLTIEGAKELGFEQFVARDSFGRVLSRNAKSYVLKDDEVSVHLIFNEELGVLEGVFWDTSL